MSALVLRRLGDSRSASCLMPSVPHSTWPRSQSPGRSRVTPSSQLYPSDYLDSPANRHPRSPERFHRRYIILSVVSLSINRRPIPRESSDTPAAPGRRPFWPPPSPTGEWHAPSATSTDRRSSGTIRPISWKRESACRPRPLETHSTLVNHCFARAAFRERVRFSCIVDRR